MKVIRAETQTGRKPDLADGSPPGGRLQPGISSDDRTDRFTDTELQAAVNLVLLSESSSASSMGKEFRRQQHRPDAAAARGRLCGAHSCASSAASSSLASVNTTHPAACGGGSADDDDEVGESGGAGSDSDPMVDEDTTGPWARVRRYRSIRGLYLVTDRVDGAIRTLAAAGRKRKGVPEPTLPALQLRTERTKRKSRV